MERRFPNRPGLVLQKSVVDFDIAVSGILIEARFTTN
jgi:hypothetical protein